MKNENRILVGSRCIVYEEIVYEVVKLSDDGVVRLYEYCESIGEGLLG